MRIARHVIIAALAFCGTNFLRSQTPTVEAKPEPAPAEADAKKHPAPAVSTIAEEEIRGFADYAPALQNLIRKAIELTKLNLGYQFGSSDPKSGGMDCSGTIYHLLLNEGIKDVPRQSDEMCRWVMRHTALYRTENVGTLTDPAFSALRPGNLLFWTGTYDTSTARDPAISHVMIYLGKRQKDGKPIVFGASDGRSYEGQRRSGVSVFDFPLPQRGDKSAFYGYGRVPGMESAPAKK